MFIILGDTFFSFSTKHLICSAESSSQKCLNVYAEVNKANILSLLNFKVSLAVAERKCEQVFEFNAQLEKEKSELMYRVHKLGRKVGKLEEMLYDADMTCGAIKQVSAKITALSGYFKNNVRTHDILLHDELLLLILLLFYIKFLYKV